MEFFQDMALNVAVGLETALTVQNLFYCFLGVLLGMVIGVVPGIGSLAAMSMLFPLTYHLDPTGALIMLAGLFYGTSYGGSTAAILLNVPGTPSSAIACVDGYPMARNGRAGVALFMTTVASFIGGSLGIVLMMAFSPSVVSIAMQFGPTEYFALMLLGLIAGATVSTGSPVRGIAMVTLGVLIGTVGLDVYTGTPRFNFGVVDLMDGVSLVALAMGIFGIAEMMVSMFNVQTSQIDKKSITFRSMIPTREELRASWAPIFRGSSIGAFFGALPGTGGLIASFVSYSAEKRLAADPSRFGKGAIEGVVAPEAANNAADQASFIPTLTLGIPGSAMMAIVLSVLIIHGITPGPAMISQRPDVFWGLVMSFWIGNILLIILNIPLIGIWVRILTIPFHYIYPTIIAFIGFGVYSVSNNVFDLWVVLFFGLLGYLFKAINYPLAPLILGFVLGPLMEERFRLAMVISRGDLAIFVSRPISASILAITAILLVWGLIASIRKRSVIG